MATEERHVSNLDEPISGKAIGRPPNRRIVSIAVTVLGLGVIVLGSFQSWTLATLFGIGCVLGLGLYHTHYGFTSSFRHFLLDRRSAGLRAQMLMILIANMLFLPLLIRGEVLGHRVTGYVFPVGLAVVAGAFLFGIGMQLADACASGTLYHTGGGDRRGILTIGGFVLGSVLGSVNFPWWMRTPHLPAISFIESLGIVGGGLLQLLIVGTIFLAVWWLERMQHGQVQALFNGGPGRRVDGRRYWTPVLQGPWSWVTGSVILAFGNFLVLMLSGKPWGITFAYALWGAKIAEGLGFQVTHWAYWQIPANAHALHQSIFHDVTTVLDFGVIVGALLGAGLAGGLLQMSLKQLPRRLLVSVFLGGIMMGYGARIAFGCNIGAYFSGVASFSLHGWLWLFSAMLGSALGVRLRPIFGLVNC
ncbi:YeeE/YedE family protein [Sulfobacillus thermosulfidooxidans]|uniref:YeeE/YedE family protein n=1 Tax=Sulfobacillus thermosulfidooxidans TaxID=28034 RepID=UPI0006B4CA27|nr:YeeE/YedE family protein [Sulfobacillus thermosulfidooxidans]